MAFGNGEHDSYSEDDDRRGSKSAALQGIVGGALGKIPFSWKFGAAGWGVAAVFGLCTACSLFSLGAISKELIQEKLAAPQNPQATPASPIDSSEGL